MSRRSLERAVHAPWFKQVANAAQEMLNEARPLQVASYFIRAPATNLCVLSVGNSEVTMRYVDETLRVRVEWTQEIKRKRRVKRRRGRRGRLRKLCWVSEKKHYQETATYTVDKAAQVAVTLGAQGLAKEVVEFVLETVGGAA